MNDPVQYLAQTEYVSLTSEERAIGRLALQSHLALSLTDAEKATVRRMLQQDVYADPAPVSMVSFFRFPAMAMAAFLLLAASGGGIVYAAENALPGDALYGVKIHVNEAVRARLHVSPEKRARWAVTRLERRMEELRRLEARGSAEAEIDVALGEHIEAAAHDVEVEVEALPAAAAERAAMRTAVRAAIGTEQDDVRRGSRVVRVLKALRERAEKFDLDPTPPTIAPVPVAPVIPAPLPKVKIDAGASASVKLDASLLTTPPSSSSRKKSSSKATSKAASNAASSIQASSSSVADGRPASSEAASVHASSDAHATASADTALPLPLNDVPASPSVPAPTVSDPLPVL